MLLGATGATRTKFYTAFSPTQAWAVWGARGEAIPVDGALELDPLFVGLGDETSWDAWAAQVTACSRPARGRSAGSEGEGGLTRLAVPAEASRRRAGSDVTPLPRRRERFFSPGPRCHFGQPPSLRAS